MSDPALPELDENARRLLALGQGPMDPPEGAKDRLRARLAASLPPGPGPGSGGSGGGTRVPLWAAGLAFVVGGAVGFAARGSREAAPELRAQAPRFALASAVPASAPSAGLSPVRPAQSAPPPALSSVPSALSAPRPRLAGLAAERAILDVARTALARGEGAQSISASREHERRFPRGALAEEREAIYVQALVLGGDKAAARARAIRFRQEYPDSMLLPAVAAATEGEP